MLGFIQFCFEVGIAEGRFIYKIDIAPKKSFQGVVEVEIVVGIVVIVNFGIEIDKEVNIAVLIKTWSKYRTENIQFVNLVKFTQGKQLGDIVLDQIHINSDIAVLRGESENQDRN